MLYRSLLLLSSELQKPENTCTDAGYDLRINRNSTSLPPSGSDQILFNACPAVYEHFHTTFFFPQHAGTKSAM